MIRSLFIIGTLWLLLQCQAKQFRFDYEYNEEAEGWLKYHMIPAAWDEARIICHAEGAVLASPLKEQLKTAIVEFVKKQKTSVPSAIFSGVHASFFKGIYSSIEGIPLLRLAITWAPGEPDNYKNSESCLIMMLNSVGVMADARCGDIYPYVCYKKEARLTFNECGTSDPEYVLEPRTGSCYKFHSRGLPWSEAYMTCEAEGGHLVIIDNDVEAAVVTEILARHPADTIFSPYRGHLFIGFHDWGHYGKSFMTIHGETLDGYYNKWANGQPDNYTIARIGDQGQSCGAVIREGLFDDASCSATVAFLCEKDPKSLHTF